MAVFKFPKRQLRKLVNEGEYEEALRLGKSLERKHPNDPDLVFIIASIYYMNGDAKNALVYLDKTLAINDLDTEALMMKANLHVYLKNKDKALECYEKLHKIDPDDKELEELLDNIEKI